MTDYKNFSEFNSIEFQLYDWMEGHDIIEGEDGDMDIEGEFIINSFGRCMDGKSVYAKIIGYTPYFYFILPNKLQLKPKLYLDDVVRKMMSYFKSSDNKRINYMYKNTLKEIQIVKLKLAEGFSNDKEFWFGRMVFTNANGMKKYKNYLEYNEITIPGVTELYKPIKLKLYEANLPPMLRCFHIREISGCSWVETSKYKLIENEDDKESRCDIEIHVDWRNLNPVKKDINAPLRICSFDIECNSIDGEFPQARRQGDCVIQIGCTYTLIGQSKPYRQYIACLNETSPVTDTIVESCMTEKELMYAFLNEINSNDCDIITGYNTFFFDEKYMYDRCKNILKIDGDMSYMSKLKSHKCNFKEMKLASSALGENLLRFWETPGRIHIDLMKDVQKTFSLPSYKLDYVASKFIRGEVTSYKSISNNMFELSCKAVNDINPGDYIHLEVIKGFVSDEVGEKYIVLEVNNNDKKIIVEGDEFLAAELDTAKQGGTIYWSQAKDDVGPKDIFRLQKGSADDRSIVAKYCVKDCRLVNLLINKLEVVTKNIEMANVCFVPLGYLFIRGQGIKLFSLCLREFRKHKYAFPVLKLDKWYRCNKCNLEYFNKWECPKCKCKEREEVETESSSYEGAIVFDPVPKVDYEAIATKDYMSLYPASIMHKNMSHETIVENPQYDNLPGIKYYNAQFKESDGSIQYRRFAQIEDKLGVIPTILNNLLKERKAIKKQMKIETDLFKIKILDAKQLAVKVTANSLYGQLGASTSPVCKRDIAACTTSTGREMLILAKKYDEEKLPWIINGLKHAYMNNENHKVEKIYDLELKARNDINLINSIKKYVTEDIKDYTFQPVIRYGDSVIGSTPLLLRNKINGKIFIATINSLANNYNLMERVNNDQHKEYCELTDIESWTEKGWTKVHRVIRHKLAKHKKIYRVTTNNGSVACTDDHSLLNSMGEEVTPTDLAIGNTLLHSFPDFNNKFNIIDCVYVFSNEYEAMKQYLIGKQKGINYMITYENKQFILSPTKLLLTDEIKSIVECDPEEYVYDLTTDNHHFHAGVGSMIVHNTDSIFSCYRFRENTVQVHKDTALRIWKRIIQFAKTLMEPFFSEKEQKIFNDVFDTYYSDDLVTDLELPKSPPCLSEPTHYSIILPLEERIKMFIKEYMEESYIPWLWTLSELVEKNYTNMFDVKIIQWGEHMLSKIKLITQDMTINRKNYIMEPIMEYINKIFINKYIMPSDDIISNFTNKFNKNNNESFPIAHEINIDMKKIHNAIKNMMEKTIKEKWVFSTERKIITKLFNDYLSKVTVNNHNNNNFDKTIYYLKQFIAANNKFDIDKLVELINKNLLYDMDLGLQFNEEKLEQNTKEFLENYMKENGTKTMNQIIEDLLVKEFDINFDLYKLQYYNKVVTFINTYMRRLDMSDIDKPEQYIYYWLQPRWDFDNNMNLIRKVDIYEGGTSITDKRTLDHGMEMGKLSGELIKTHLPFPHDCEYEKTFWPFAILTKKRYVGNKYDDDPNKYKQDFMGIVLKRRDNAPIVKEICGGIIDQLINKRSPEGAKQYLIDCLERMFNGMYDIKYFLQSRTLKMKESYKDWTRIAHVYLAEKIAQRDPGNTPQSGDRIEFAVIKVPPPLNGEKLLQGDIIEIPSYIKQKKLEIDYLFYLTNQIMNPALQFLELVDPKASKIFEDFITMYKTPKIKKEKVIKEKVIKEKVVKEKVIKEKVIKEKVVKEKVVKEKVVKEKNALDLLIEAKRPSIITRKKFILEIKKFIDEINEFMENHKVDRENIYTDIFIDSEL